MSEGVGGVSEGNSYARLQDQSSKLLPKVYVLKFSLRIVKRISILLWALMLY